MDLSFVMDIWIKWDKIPNGEINLLQLRKPTG